MVQDGAVGIPMVQDDSAMTCIRLVGTDEGHEKRVEHPELNRAWCVHSALTTMATRDLSGVVRAPCEPHGLLQQQLDLLCYPDTLTYIREVPYILESNPHLNLIHT
jgi:hypothetical protein